MLQFTGIDSILKASPRRRWVALLAWFVCSLSLLAVYWRPKATPLDVDEIYWIGSAYYYDLAFVQCDWRHPDWQLQPARENPPVAKYVIGMSLAATGRRVSSVDLLGCFYAMYESTPGAWGKGAAYEKREQVVARMNPELHRRVRDAELVNLTPDMLTPGRCAMLACVVATSFFVLLCGRLIGSWPAGLVASQLLLLHPAVIYAYNHATSDAVALMFSTAAALFGISFVGAFASGRQMRFGRAMTFSLVTGTLLALACGAKLNSLVVLFAIAAMILTSGASMLLVREHEKAAKLLVWGGTVIAIACVGFIVLNPTTLNDLFGGLKACVTEHRLTEDIQAGFLTGHLTTLGEKLNAVTALAFYERFGCGVVAALALWWLRRGQSLALRFSAAWWIIAFLCVTLWIPFDWLRYVLPLVVPSVLLIGWTLQAALISLQARLARAGEPGALRVDAEVKLTTACNHQADGSAS